MYKKRLLENKIKELASYFKIVLVVGARQVGKSTMLAHLFPQAKHITFDPVQDLYGAKADPDLFLLNFQTPLILDEIQYVPNLLSALKRKVDQSDAKGQYLLTGSQNISILKTVSESLAGRVAIIHLGSLTPYELADIPDKHWIESYLDHPDTFFQNIRGVIQKDGLYASLWRGGYPGLLGIPDHLISTFYSSYVQTYVERDIRLIENIQDLALFDRFLGVSAALTAQEINASHLGREIGITHVTAGRWLDLIKHSYLWIETLPYSGNTIKRISAKRKGYIADTGLACYLQRISSPEALARSPLLGPLFESACVEYIIAICENLKTIPKFYHWRTSSGAEVDLIIELNGKFYPIEMKLASNVSRNDGRGIKAFRDTYPNLPIQKGIILYGGSECYMLDNDTIALPWNSHI